MIGQPIKKAMNKLDAARWLVQCAIKLSQFNIKYKPWLAIKAQVLADYITDFTFSSDDQTQLWTVHTNGSFVKELEGIGVVMISLDKDVLKYGV